MPEKLARLSFEFVRSTKKVFFRCKGLKASLTRRLETLPEEEASDVSLEQIIDTKLHLHLEIDKDERFWEQRACANWLKVGDKNLIFFHKYTSSRRSYNLICSL